MEVEVIQGTRLRATASDLDERITIRARKLSEHMERNLTVSVEEARAIVLDSINPLAPERIPLIDAFDRILYEDIVSDVMIPSADDSAMDGYAIIAADTRGASRNNPARLRVTGEIRAGGSAAGKRVSHGEAVRIMTGAPIPQGADAVVRFEDTEEESGHVDVFSESVKSGNCKCAGENIKKGETVLQKGDRLRSADIGLLASLNYETVRVYKKAAVSIVSTGDELAEIGEDLCDGGVRNVNAYTLCSEVKKSNAIPHYVGIAKDTKEDIRRKISEALESDVVITTGGVSMGRYDLVKEIYHELDVALLFEWVDVKPGRPCAFGVREKKLIFGLPGYPVPTLTSFIQFVRPALLRLMGARRVDKPLVSAYLEGDAIKPTKCVNLLRGRFVVRGNEFRVSITGSQKSSVLRSMSKANCLIVIPKDSPEIRAGEKVAIQLIDHDEI
jgi:molybdopterin molybdotransferase